MMVVVMTGQETLKFKITCVGHTFTLDFYRHLKGSTQRDIKLMLNF